MGLYNNPILAGFNPDPSIVRVGPDYFLVTSTFEYFPGVPIYHSRDLVSWTLVGHALTRRSQLDVRTPEAGGGVWAPTIRHRDGVFYVAAACFDRYRPQADDRVWPRGFCVWTRDVWGEGGWSEPVWFDQVGFDQDLFWDTSTSPPTVLLSTTFRNTDNTSPPQPLTTTTTTTTTTKTKNFSIHLSPTSLPTGRALAPPVLARSSPVGPRVAEGAHLFRRGRWVYLFSAEGGTEGAHREVVCRMDVSGDGDGDGGGEGDGVFGRLLRRGEEAWEVGPVVLGEGLGDDGDGGEEGEVGSCGHADLVEDEGGRWWAVFLGVRRGRKGKGKGVSVFGRETFLVPVTWVDDWPVFNADRKVGLVGEAEGLYQLASSPAWRDDFAAEKMQLGWYRKNTPLKEDYSLTERPGYLRLYGGPYTLSTPACPTVFLRKQTHDPVTWETRLSFRPDSSKTEAGAVVYWNQHTYSSIGIRKAPEGGRIIRVRPAEGEAKDFQLKSLDSDVVLTIKSDDGYELGFKEFGLEHDEVEVRWVGRVSSEIMTRDPSVGAAFTGMMLGVYAFGELEQCFAPADFEYATSY
ncbi:glycoside hydrolase family 43 protein [Diplodia corticola]|uniref:Glycoside hydrolase family 43 protein n=1 Tax=Diplodia corticola TaxID=236234 RepID=A0A1J9QYR0_9PEZI|nr:glycoside hydrolase family 43 protein [Diplodia corticola]OJD33521.1 glycoside hydrolase family 43 protein [Diplodia corticola]